MAVSALVWPKARMTSGRSPDAPITLVANVWRALYRTISFDNCSASFLAAGGPSSGLLSHAHKSLKMNSCWRTRAARLDSDQPKLDFICRYFKMSMAIKAVQICVLTAFALVPRNDFTFAVSAREDRGTDRKCRSFARRS